MSDAPVPAVPVRFDGKVVVVTGASRGIGRVLATGFAQSGANVVIVARREAELGEVEEQIRAEGGESRSVVADLGDASAPDRVVAAAVAAYGTVDVVVNNVGIAGPTAPIEDTDLEDWRTTLDVNLTSAFLVTRAVVPVMKSRGAGSIINIGSINGKTPFAFRSAYAASKMGMIGMTRTLALELGPSGIRVNCILPANVAGERVEEVFSAQAEARGITVEEAKRDILELSPLRTQVAPESILNTALFLASDHAPHITGLDINVTAGMLMS